MQFSLKQVMFEWNFDLNFFLEEPCIMAQYQLTSRPSDRSITRLVLMSYFPSGFWSRLISRILADDTIVDIIRSFFILPKEVSALIMCFYHF